MAYFRKREILTYDEPVTYDKFNGGINTDPSNDNLLPNEVKDAVNMHYASSILERRKGAQIVRNLAYVGDYTIETDEGTIEIPSPKELVYDTSAKLVHQGMFPFYTSQASRMILARNGYLLSADDNGSGDLIFDILHIDVTKYYEDPEFSGPTNPRNMCVGLEVVEERKTNKHNGYVLKYQDKISVGEGEEETEELVDRYELIYQNNRPIQGVIYKNKMYIATGTRIIVVYEKDDILYAEPLDPRVLNSWDIQYLGFNNLSPFPERLLKEEFNIGMTRIGNLIVTDKTDNDYTFKLFMSYDNGKTASDYRFKWEISEDNGATWSIISTFKNSASAGKTTHVLTADPTKKYKIRCTFGRSFKSTWNPADDLYYYNELDGDYVLDKADGEWFGSIMIDFDPAKHDYTQVSQKFLDISSCVKVTGDGNKFLFYDDINETGNWYKTVIDKPDYITDRGGLSFQTTKNEKLVGVVNFKGVIIAFSNGSGGGNISIVNGNGDDVEADGQDFSPYVKRIVNTSTSCDNYASIQATDNFLLFKYGKVIYALDSSELSKDIISLLSVNDRLTPKNRYNTIDWDRDDYFTEVTEDYYGIIWPAVEKINEDGTISVIKEAYRAKMYFRYMQQIDNSNKPFFPWLKDISPALDIVGTVTLEGKSCHLTIDEKLVNYSSDVYYDYNHVYESSLKLKGVDLAYPKLMKFLSNIILYYYRGQEDVIKMYLTARNEAGHLLYREMPEAFMDYGNDTIKYTHKDTYYDRVRTREDYRVLIADETPLIEKVRLDSTTLDTKVYTPEYKFPFLLVELEIRIATKQAFSLASVTYNYTSTDVPDQTVFDLYTDIIKKRELE